MKKQAQLQSFIMVPNSNGQFVQPQFLTQPLVQPVLVPVQSGLAQPVGLTAPLIGSYFNRVHA